MKGYQLIEPEILESVYSVSPCNEIMVGILLWVTHKLKNRKFIEIEVDLIIANSHGNKYPTLAIHYINDSTKDMESVVSELVTQIIDSFNFSDYITFTAVHTDIIKKFVNKLK